MKKLWKQYHENIIIFILLAVLVIGSVSIIAIFSGTVMKLFGFEYNSIRSVIVFFLLATILSYPISLFVETLPKVLLSLGHITKSIAIILYIVLDTTTTAFGLNVVDYFMNSISATNISIWIISFLLMLPGIKDINQRVSTK